MTSGTLHDMISAAIRLSAPKANYLTDPEAWIRERQKDAVWSKQDAVLQSVRDNRFTAVPSCHGAGKSWLGGKAIVWFIDTRTPGEAFVISTAPSAAQVSAILWREVGKAHRKGKLPGRITVAGYPQWKMHDGPDGLVGYGRKPSDYTDSAFQGIHAPEGVLIVVDEANGVSRNLFQQIDSIASNEDCRVLLLGNPTDPSSYFAEACRPGSKYNVIRVDGLRTPLMTAERIVGKLPLLQALMEAEGIPYSTEDVPPVLRKALVNPMWVEECLQDWCGVDPVIAETLSRPELEEAVTSAANGSAAFTSRVRAEFPAIDTNSVIPLHWVEQAMVRWEDWKAGDPARGIPPEAEPPGRRVLGVDVAREGQDKTAVAVRQGLVVQKVLSWHKEDTMQTVARVRPLLDHPQAQAVVDTIGVGAGVFDRLRQLCNTQRGDDGQLIPQQVQGSVVQFIASEQSGRTDRTGKFRFRNDRMAAWWNMRELLDPSRGSKVCLPRSTELLVQLSTPRWWILEGSPTILVETKDELRKRLKRSPDEADACFPAGTLITTARGQVPIEQVIPGDSAWTRVGWRPVLAAAMTNPNAELLTVELADGRTLTGTPSHPVWDGSAFRRLDSFTDTDIMTLWQPSTSPTAGSFFGVTPTVSTGTSGSTTGQTGLTRKLAWALYTLRSTARKWGRSRTAGTSTTATSTRWTTALRIWKRSPRVTTSRSTPRLAVAGATTSPTTLPASVNWPKPGTVRPRGLSGTAGTAGRRGATGDRNRSVPAMAAAPKSSPSCPLPAAGSVDGAAGRAISATSTGTPKSTASPRRARSVKASSSACPADAPVFAAIAVRRSRASGRSAVWNLQVQGQPEYLANGILVHNCVMAFWLAGAPSIGEDSPEGQPVAYDDPLADVTGVIGYPTDYADGLLGGSDGYGTDSW